MSSLISGWAKRRLIATLAFGLALTTSALAAIPGNTPADVARALGALNSVDVIQAAPDGVPTFLRGDLGQAPKLNVTALGATESTMRPVLSRVLAALRLRPADLHLRKVNIDAMGNQHLRYVLTHRGIDVVGGDLVVHVDGKGRVFAINGSARGDIAASLGSNDIGESAVHPVVMADARFAGMATTPPRRVYFVSPQGLIHMAYETVATGLRGQDPVRDKVYVDVDSGAIVGVHPQIHFAENRRVYSANNGTSLPGTLKRSEGQGANSDIDVNAAYDGTGATYEAYKAFWNRDSYNNAGAALISSVHYSTNYCNAFWNGTQMVYGDGNSGQGCLPLARAQDVTAHELTHAVTENESGLVYSGESGGMNEAMSDIFGAFTEAYVDGGKTGTLTVSTDTWKIGEDILPPALRYMNDPAADGASKDYWYSGVGNVDVHYSSGIANLAFYLLSQGGTHPRGKSAINVTGLGMDKAIRIFYEANVNVLTSNANFLAAGNATVQAAVNLGYTLAEQTSVANAWQAVGVPVPNPGGGGGGGDTVLTNGTPVSGLSGASGSQAFFKIDVPAGQTTLTITITGGTGDADLYTRRGSRPTLSTYDCRPYKTGNAETCTYTAPAAGTYYVLLNGYSAYSGVTLTATYSVGGGDPYLTNGQPVTGISGATGSQQYWRINTPAGKTLTISISGGTGDADLYTRFGSRPTTSTYLCRPYKTGNAETCTVTATSAGDYYIMLRGYSTFSGVSLVASY
ncbi:M4 family metallopeptidase [Ideonella sp. YS5]|uniref:M4 family metallopeptidase n=1 Tax=Ideonella sp. YS5 TaxID=3453714 RepID=UPI003EE8C991